jgi:hypothetical protein
MYFTCRVKCSSSVSRLSFISNNENLDDLLFCKLFNLFIYRQSILYFFKLYFQAGRRLKQPVSVIRRATLATCRETKNETVIFQFFLDSCITKLFTECNHYSIYGLNYVNLFTAPYEVCATYVLRISHVVINCILEFCISDILLCLNISIVVLGEHNKQTCKHYQ